MKYVLALFVALLVFSTLTACGQQSAVIASSVDVDIALWVGTEPLTVGETTLIITLTDDSGTRINGARLQVHGGMDHAGMTPVDHEVSESMNGEYRVPFEWTMGGNWIVTVTTQLGNESEISKTFDFFVEAVSSESIVNRRDNVNDAAVNFDYQPDHDPALSGDSIVTITLTDQDRNPITNASVDLVGDMSHHGMLPISAAGEHTENGQYVVPVRWTMAGEWKVTVNVTLADGRQFQQVFDQKVVTP